MATFVSPVPDDNFTRRAVVLKVHDGDTCTLDVDLGFWTHEVMACRLAGLNAIELGQPGGAEARDHLAGLIPVGSAVRVDSIRPDKYAGRFDGRIFTLDGQDICAQMIADGYAAPWDGSGARPVPPWPIPVTGRRDS